MLASDAGRAASRALHRAGWLLHAHRLETKLQALRDAVKYDPNQPRVPAGNPDGGQWTDGGGAGGRLPSGPGTLLDVDDDTSERIRLAQARRGRGGTGYVTLRTGVRTPATFRQEAELQGLWLRASRLERQIRGLDPNWRPTPSFVETVQGEIDATRAEVRQAETYLYELRVREVGPGPYAKRSFPARGPDVKLNRSEQAENNRNGREDGCHTCGTREPGMPSGNFVGDHQRPSALIRPGETQRIYPQCRSCSQRQGGQVGALSRNKNRNEK